MAPESGEPSSAGRTRGRAIDPTDGTPVGDRPAPPGSEVDEDFESGRHDVSAT